MGSATECVGVLVGRAGRGRGVVRGVSGICDAAGARHGAARLRKLDPGAGL